MLWIITLLIFTNGWRAADWIAAGDRALDAGDPRQAATDFSRALDVCLRTSAPAEEALHLRVTLATAYMEARNYHDAEQTLQEASRAAGPTASGLARAELLNAESALDFRRGELSAAEGALVEAWQIVARLPAAEDLRPTVLHNMAAAEMRTQRYADALVHEQAALRMWQNALSPDHPKLIRAWASLASLEYMLRQHEEARMSMERALMSAERTYGPSNPLLADLLESDAIILDQLKLKKRAQHDRERAREIRGAAEHAASGRLTWDIREAPEGAVYLRGKY